MEEIYVLKASNFQFVNIIFWRIGQIRIFLLRNREAQKLPDPSDPEHMWFNTVSDPVAFDTELFHCEGE